ncbi:8-oxo-dGTP diphosphatase MutT [Oceanospirillaceae bacterium]|jgi:8-oxo-dGTP diphosphatase|uniref:8-oxo-dGTP diphosphatase MutT n=1 Tax=Candidatus Njordibacter sp. Uisw_002 TaxID=3230971 RepID=UPI00236F6F89|nr:8-oxo-dGTP diphosphatase MutT [Oceanospirillaceae bacterium]MDC1340292.1 8-oxo-dGTP diphosphatase MutT [Oceanospirillaceae bacterium]|tara:strand:- start:461 stop:871 length:411 start_codon:yes stop_codon:yes gene_type:complete
MNKRVEVVAAIVVDSQQRILMAQRAHWQHQGGKWEFPGGKIETDETHLQALARELEEEVDLQIDQRFCELFKAVHHDYADKNVSLYFYLVKNASGIAKGMEDQPVLWVDAKTLSGLAIPDANKAIADALLETWPVS